VTHDSVRVEFESKRAVSSPPRCPTIVSGFLPGGMLEAEGEAHLRAVVDQLEDIVVLVTLLVLEEVGEMVPVCRSETSWAYREMPGTWREHPKPPARAVEC